MTMHRMAWVAIALMGAFALDQQGRAGDRDAVSEQLDGITANWPEALFSIDVKGASDGSALLSQTLGIQYEAAAPGYLAYVRLSSHGDVTLVRDMAKAAKSTGTEPYVIKPPLGSEQLLVLFANAPWDPFFPKGSSTRELGANPEDIAAFVQQLTQLTEQHLVFAARRYELDVQATPGGTQYTTRGIIRTVIDASNGKSGAGAGGGAARIPSRIDFEFGSDGLTEQGKLDLDTFGEALVTDLRNSSVALEGHTDAVGSDEYNQALSERRAAAAKQYLIDSFGIVPSRLTATGMGKSNPIASNDDAAGRSQNRRVDFIFFSTH
jgi:outer membrane protein OmpA-like peptidoglycan-associated protein